MERSGSRFSGVSVWLVMAFLAMAGGISGCVTTGSGKTPEKTLWESRDQYVKIEQQDRQAGATAIPNDHPANVSADRVRDMLEGVELRLPGEEKGTPLFNDDEIRILGDNISAGLAQAGPGQDVTFAIIGHYPALMGLLKGRMVTTGRVFCRAGELNIIFGDVHRLLRDNEDRRLQPFLPGRRGEATNQELRFAIKAGWEPFDVKRPDWVAFSLAAPAAPAPAAPPASGGTATEEKAPAAPVGKPAAGARRTAEERLLILNDLHNKKLITDEEYRTKRQEILNEL